MSNSNDTIVNRQGASTSVHSFPVSYILLLAFALIPSLAASATPPTILKIVPSDGDMEVDPALKEIRVEFDHDMDTKNYSVCGSGPNYPASPGKPRWLTKRVFVMPVRLKSDHEYQISINCPSAKGFHGQNGEAVEPTPVSFKTRAAAAGRQGKESGDHHAAAAELRRLIDEEYSYRDLRKVPWADRFQQYQPKLEKAKSAGEFAKHAAEFLAAAKDMHITLKLGEKPLATHRRKVKANVNLKTLAEIVPQWRTRANVVFTGKFEDGIAYILIGSWTISGKDEEALHAQLLDEAASATALIVDVRTNSGGDEALARRFAARFISETAVYSKNIIRDIHEPGGFSAPIPRTIEPAAAASRFKGKVAVLMGPVNMSSCESFLLMMRCSKNANLVGEKSYGSSGNPKEHDLGNGVSVLLPSWKDSLPDGTLLEGLGITPDIRVKSDQEGSTKSDPVLEAALNWLRKK